MYKAYKYRLYPTDEQRVLINKALGCARFVYNWGLARKIKSYEATGKTLSSYSLMKELTQLKKQEEFIWLNEVASTTLQYSILNLGKAYENFFRDKKALPKFKSKKDNHARCSFIQNITIDQSEGLISVLKIKGIRYIHTRDFIGKIGTVTISKTPTGKYFISVLVDNGEELPKKKAVRKKTTVGVDLGVKHFATFSTGEKIDNPKFLDRSAKKLRRVQRSLSRKVKGSKNRDKSRIKVARCHERITNQRTDFLHKLSTRLIRENQTISIETLNISGMLQNRKLSRSISQLGWNEFTMQLKYKGEWYGKNILCIGAFEPSSKTCSNCNHKNVALTLSDRDWTCPNCGVKHDRDVNAANNIKAFGINNIPLGEREFTPVENRVTDSVKQEVFINNPIGELI